MSIANWLTLPFMSVLCLCQQAPTASPTIPNIPEANSELVQLVVQDQWDRGNDMFGGKEVSNPESLNWKLIRARDVERHAAVRKLLSSGKLKTGKDFYYAALIFQHSVTPDDLVVAHTLAVTAATKGESGGKWLAAATMDRYLWRIKQPQVFGTQFQKEANGRWTMSPYSQEILSDAMRALWCVVPTTQQERIMKKAQDGNPLESTAVRDCE